MRRDSDFIDGRWLPPWDPGASENFEFVQDATMARLLRIAEANAHVDPNTTLVKLRQFGELLTRHAAPSFGTYPGAEEAQVDLLRRLGGPKGIDRNILDELHAIRRQGNAAVHEHVGDRRAAIGGLKSAQRLAWWFEVEVSGRRIPKPTFQSPMDPQVRFAELAQQLEEAKTAKEQLAEERERLAEDAVRAAHLAEEEATARRAAELARAESEEEARTWRLLAEEQEASSSSASLARRLETLRADLQALGMDDGSSAGLPDWTAAVVAGDEPPVGLPEELVEDLRALAAVFPVPPIQTPDVIVESEGNLAATARVPLAVRPTIRNPESLDAAEQRGGVWVDASGNEFLVPQRLRTALDDLAEGPPAASEDEAVAETTRRRQLWWGRLRRELEHFGVDLRGYLGATDAVVVDRLKPRLVIREDGAFEVRFSSDELTEDEATGLVDGADVRRPRDQTLSHRAADGSTQRRRVFLSDTGKEAVSRAAQVRRMGPRAGPYLRDALDSVFDPELFDLSEYGDRVVGIGKPVYRVSPSMVDRDGRTRFGLVPSSDSDDAGPVELSSEEQAQLADLLAKAAAKGLDYVPFRGGWVRVPTPQRAAELAGHRDNVRRGGVLLVDENTEELSYEPGDSGEGGRAVVPERPPGLAEMISLMPHQLDGVSWLAGHALVAEGASDHGLLADDMGLGKTLQVLSLMSLLQESGRLKAALVVAPLSLLDNWTSEADRFFPGRFSNRVRLGGGVRLSAERLRGYDLVLTSYDTLRSQQLELGRVRWSLMVCDECHRIRNPTALTTRAVLAMDAECRIGLSGTPVQNSLIDLWSQFDWLAPGVLGDLKGFRKRFIQVDEDRDVALAGLRSNLGPRILRRLKRDTISGSLPGKHIERIRLPMDPGQVDLYDRLLADFRGGPGRAFKILPRLMQVSADPLLVAAGPDGASGPKLRWLLSKLREIAERGEKAVVFAEWYALQERVAALVRGAFGAPVDRINGSVEAGLRLAKIDAFSQRPGFGVLVLGPKATGVGLNITAANHVVHLTRHWNPALEAQATDRTYRIGQERAVHVYLPIAVHPRVRSIDEHLDGLLEAKEGLAEDFLTGFDDLSVSKDLEAAMRGEAS